MVKFSKDTTYRGVKSFEAHLVGEPELQGARLTIEQEYRGAKTWCVYNKYFTGGRGETATRVFGSGLSRKQAKALATELLLRAVVGVEPGGRLVLVGEHGV